MRPKASSMITFGYIMMFANMLGAGIFWLLHDRGRVAMFMAGSMLWIIMILIWYKVKERDDNEHQ